jgi:hypothetical protein
LLLKAADPELAALVRHVGLGGGHRGSDQGAALEQTSHEKESHHRNAEAEIGQGELRQERDGALTAGTQVAANADRAVKVYLHQGATVEAVSGQRMLGLALGAVIRSMPIGVSNLFVILLDRAGERV